MRTRFQNIGLILGPVFFVATLFYDFEPGAPGVSRMAAVTVLMVVWWITEAVPLATTALMPLVLFPLFGILHGKLTAAVYINSTIFLFIGGFIIALAMERWNLHKRIALVIIRFVGGGPSRIILGFMVAAGFLSMWISNTATAIMMLPMGIAIVAHVENEFDPPEARDFSVALMLGIAYACSVGGLATLVGTPPNLVFQRVFELTYPKAPSVSFGQWFLMCFPLSLLLGGLIWLALTKIFFRFSGELRIDPAVIERQYKELGPISYEEKVVAVIFAVTAVLWIFRENLVLGFVTVPGWANLLPFPHMIDDGTVALFMALVLFFIPAKSEESRLVDESVFKHLPWGIVILFGGGFALAKGFQVTGLSEFIGNQMIGLAHVHPLIIVMVSCLLLTFVTELTSNTATSQMILPILASLAVVTKLNPLVLMIPATLSCSCAFMLPVGTPPNAIIFGSRRVKIKDMARIGLLLNFAGAAIISFFFYWIGATLMKIDMNSFPDWALVLTK